MKKLLALLLSLCMVFSCACGSNTETSEDVVEDVAEEVVEEETDGESFDPSEYLEKVEEPVEEPVEETTTDETSQIVYVTKSGSKYHSAGCQYLKKSCIEKDLSEAESQGYTPCSKCW